MKQNRKFLKSLKRQAGISLLEATATLLIGGIVIAGALALWGNADSSQQSNQIQSDLSALRGAVKGLYSGQGGYGTSNLNSVLKNAKKIPSDLAVDSSTPPVITHGMNGTVTVTGATANYTIALTNIPTDVCVTLLTGANAGWSSVQVGSASAITTFPISPAVASSATNCAASTANTLTFTGA